MSFKTRCIPLGSLPYESVDAAAKMQAKLFEQIPYLPFFPILDKEDSLYKRSFSNIPGIKLKDKKIILKTTSSAYKQNLTKLDKAYNNPTLENLEPYGFEAIFLEKYFHLIRKFRPEHACINLLGPFTISQLLTEIAEENRLTDKSYRKLITQSVCVKALWAIEKIKKCSPKTTPIIILEEPKFSHFGDLKRENEDITAELVVSVFSRVIEKLKEAGALIAIQCLEKCNWQIPIKAGVDIISFDAYNNPNNLCIMPEAVIEFIERGGLINWAIVPVMNETLVKSLNSDLVYKRLQATLDGLILAGVSRKKVYESALISVQGNTEHLPVIFAEKAAILANQVAKKIAVLH